MSDLKDANTNPWYLMMTLYGEAGESDAWEKNRLTWNAWACSKLSYEQREIARAKLGNEVPGLEAWLKIKRKVEKLFAERVAYCDPNLIIAMPDPAEPINMSNIRFLKDLMGDQKIYPTNVSFKSSVFDSSIVLDRSVFLSGVDFSGVKMNEWAVFKEINFGGKAIFSEAQFNLSADFQNSVFEDTASFLDTTFMDNAQFYEVTFKKHCYFTKAKFLDRADFHDTKFSSANFSHSKFQSIADFSDAKFVWSANFSTATFQERSIFLEAKFGTEQSKPRKFKFDFSDAQFEKSATFRNAAFAFAFPDFTGAVLHPGTILPTDEDAWPIETAQNLQELADNCGFLRHHFNQQGRPEAEMFFFRKEMRYLTKAAKSWRWFPYWFYGMVSNYGHSIARPLLGLVALWFLPILIYTDAPLFDVTVWFDIRDLGEDAAFSFANIFKFFGFQRTYFGDEMKMLSGGRKTLSAFQTVAGFALLFFLGLGLRSRFRLR